MIQRVQSIYLLITVVISSLLSYYSVEQIINHTLASFFKSNYGFFIFTGFSLIVFFLYKKRTLQAGVCLFMAFIQLLLLILFVMVYVSGEESTFVMLVSSSSIFQGILFLVARKSILKDEKLVRSVDRIR
ncbi:MAG: DUF4293 family protein [Flavobacteriaceae bacterium]